jgi:hypothetical protein
LNHGRRIADPFGRRVLRTGVRVVFVVLPAPLSGALSLLNRGALEKVLQTVMNAPELWGFRRRRLVHKQSSSSHTLACPPEQGKPKLIGLDLLSPIVVVPRSWRHATKLFDLAIDRLASFFRRAESLRDFFRGQQDTRACRSPMRRVVARPG